MKNENIYIYKDWIKTEDYEFKILVLLGFLADNSLAYRGTMKKMCEWLCVADVPTNTKRIKQAIKGLEDKEYILYKKEGQTHHISITNKGLKSKRIIEVRKQWIEVIKNYNIAKDCNINRSWDTMTKVLVSLLDKLEEAKNDLDLTNGFIVTMEEIREDINKSNQTISKAIDKLTECNFYDGLVITKNVERIKNANNEYRTIGTKISINYEFEKTKKQ